MPANTSALLAGLSLATGIASEATDGVPIVKQVLGVASRIVRLAEQVDKNREDLQALADRAKRMDRAIATVVGDREPDDHLLSRLEDVTSVLRAVEKYFEVHIKQGRVRRTLGYILTASKDIDRLKGEVDDRLRELEVAANLDTNIFSRDNSRFIGEVRVDSSRVSERNVGRDAAMDGAGKAIFHLANCEGSNKVFVVRSMAGLDKHQRNRTEDHYRILERLSLIQNRHPAITCLYGRNIGPKDNRFVVLDAGKIRPLDDELRAGPADLSILGQLVAQLADAACHLQRHRVAWSSCGPTVYIDNKDKPTVGIDDDLYSTTIWAPESCASWVSLTLAEILDETASDWHSVERPFPDAHLRSTAWCKELLGDLIDAGYRTYRRENMVRRADLTSLIPLGPESWTYLHQADRTFSSSTPSWGLVLLRLAAGNVRCEGSLVEAVYVARSAKSDALDLHCLQGDADIIHLTDTVIEIPRSAAEEVRRRFGITSSGEDAGLGEYFLQRLSGDDATQPQCGGWAKWDSTWKLWEFIVGDPVTDKETRWLSRSISPTVVSA